MRKLTGNGNEPKPCKLIVCVTKLVFTIIIYFLMTTKDTKNKVNPYALCYNPIFFSFIDGQNILKYYNNDVDIKIYSFLYKVIVAE
jgi:hypothetical protein